MKVLGFIPKRRGALFALLASLQRHGYQAAWLVVFAFVIVASSRGARAELPPPECFHGWWVDAPWLELRLEDLPPLPWVPLPIVWSAGPSRATEPTERDFLPDRLEVEVEDELGASVPGTLAMRDFDGFVGLGKLPWWRPDAPLTPGGTYTVRIAVHAPPTDEWGYRECTYRSFGATLHLTTALEPPLVELALLVETRDTFSGPIADWFLCEGRDDEVPCSSFPRVCCERNWTPYRSLYGAATVGELPNDDRYFSLIFTFERPDARLDVRRIPLRSPRLLVDLAIEWTAPHGAPPSGSECVMVELESLIADAILASERRCAQPDDHLPYDAGRDGFECTPSTCATLETYFNDRNGARAEEADTGPQSSRPGCGLGSSGLGAVLWLFALQINRRRWGRARTKESRP